MKPESHIYVKELLIMNGGAPAGIETEAKTNAKIPETHLLTSWVFP